MKIKDIAEMAEVSSATVSRVINNSGYVKDEVRERVEKIIQETGYVPNQAAKSLKTKKSNLIGVIVPNISTETASRVVGGVTTVANQEGYEVLIANTGLDPKEELRYIRVFKQKSIDGLILMATEITKEHIKLMKELNIPIVCIGQDVEGQTSVVHDDYNAVRDIMNIVLEYGHKDIAFIGVPEKDIAVGQVRRKAYEDALKEVETPVNDEIIEIGDFSIESGYSCAKKIIEGGQKPTAILAATDNIALGAMHYLLQNGYSIPEDISVVGVGGSKISEIFNPPLTTVYYGHKTAGVKAAKKVLSMVNSEKGLERELITMNYELKIRKSLRKLK